MSEGNDRLFTLIVSRLDRIETKVDGVLDDLHTMDKTHTERLSVIETKASLRGAVSGAIVALLTSLAGAVVIYLRFAN